MKTKLILMLLILSASTVLYAGSGKQKDGEGYKDKQHHGKQHRKNHLSDLNMTESQQASFEAIMKNKRDKMKAAMDVIHAETQAELSKVLSADQMKLLEEKKHNRKGMAKKHKMKKHMKQKNQKRKEKSENQE